MDRDNPWIALLKVWIHALRNNPWIVCSIYGSRKRGTRSMDLGQTIDAWTLVRSGGLELSINETRPLTDVRHWSTSGSNAAQRDLAYSILASKQLCIYTEAARLRYLRWIFMVVWVLSSVARACSHHTSNRRPVTLFKDPRNIRSGGPNISHIQV